MSCGDRVSTGQRKFRRVGFAIPAGMKRDENMFVGYKVKAKPAKYNAVFIDMKSTVKCEENYSGWVVSVIGNEVFVSEEDMGKYFELVEEMDIPFEDELPPEIREEYRKRKKTKTEEVT